MIYSTAEFNAKIIAAKKEFKDLVFSAGINGNKIKINVLSKNRHFENLACYRFETTNIIRPEKEVDLFGVQYDYCGVTINADHLNETELRMLDKISKIFKE